MNDRDRKDFEAGKRNYGSGGGPTYGAGGLFRSDAENARSRENYERGYLRGAALDAAESRSSSQESSYTYEPWTIWNTILLVMVLGFIGFCVLGVIGIASKIFSTAKNTYSQGNAYAAAHGFPISQGTQEQPTRDTTAQSDIKGSEAQKQVTVDCNSSEDGPIVAALAPSGNSNDSATISVPSECSIAKFEPSPFSGSVSVCSFYDASKCLTPETPSMTGQLDRVVVKNISTQAVDFRCVYSQPSIGGASTQ